MEIYVPTGKTVKNKTAVKEEPLQFTEYIVQKQETLYGISKKTGVSVDDLIKLNPEIKNGLKTGMALKIAVKKPVTEVKKEEHPLSIVKKDTVRVKKVVKEESMTEPLVVSKTESTPETNLASLKIL